MPKDPRHPIAFYGHLTESLICPYSIYLVGFTFYPNKSLYFEIIDLIYYFIISYHVGLGKWLGLKEHLENVHDCAVGLHNQFSSVFKETIFIFLVDTLK